MVSKKDDKKEVSDGMDDYAKVWVNRYMGMWKQGYSMLPTGLTDDTAKVAAINTMMIDARGSGVLKIPKECMPQEAVTKEEAAPAPTSVPKETPKEMKEEVTSPLPEKAPEKKAEQERPKPSAPKQTGLPQNDIPLGFDGQPMPAYDKDKPGWNYCPNCASLDVTHDKKPPKKGTYQACWDCRIWLDPAGGKVRPMDALVEAD